MTTTSRLEPHELKDALLPGLFPGEDTAGPAVAEWEGLDALRDEHDAAIALLHNAARVHVRTSPWRSGSSGKTRPANWTRTSRSGSASFTRPRRNTRVPG
jgi:hypothetical protein